MARAEHKRLITAATRLLSRDSDVPFLKALARDLFANADTEDLAAYRAEEIAGFARSAAERLAARMPGHHKVWLGEVGDHHKPTTLVEILNDDMPFLVDSVIDELQDFGADIHLVAHPIISLERNRKGVLQAYHGTNKQPPASKTIRESFLQIHIGRIASERDRVDLAGRLDKVLSDVRLVVGDWKAMRARLRQIIIDLRLAPPPLAGEEISEAIEFLEWLDDENFTFLGVRDYNFISGRSRGGLRRASMPGLGILSDPSVHVLRRGHELSATPPDIRAFLMRPAALIVAKANIKSRIHRRAYMDYVGVKLFGKGNKFIGEIRFVGLFTSTAYTRSIRTIPYFRRKVDGIVARAGHDPESHSGKALINVLETYPRDELFQIDEETLFDFAMAILRLGGRPRVRVLARRDEFDRFVSVIVFVPRNRFNTEIRTRIGDYLKTVFIGRVSAFYPAFPEGSLVRVHFIIGRAGGQAPNPSREELEGAIGAIVRTWGDDLSRILGETLDLSRSARLAERYGEAFPLAYRDNFSPETALADLDRIEGLTRDRSLAVEFYSSKSAPSSCVGLKLIYLGESIALSKRVPVLEHMGFRVIDERTYNIVPAGDPSPVHIHDMSLEVEEGRTVDLKRIGASLTACFMAVWYDEAESDGYNALVVNAGLAWRDIALLRAISRFLRQARRPYSQDYMWNSLNRHAEIAAMLVDMFRARFDPLDPESASPSDIATRIDAALKNVQSLDEDRIICSFVNIISAMLRTNFFRSRGDGTPHAEISLKLDSRMINGLPEPRPFREIFVYSPRVEGVHLRFGKAARGGIRWSDRPQDFRTEILGLAKAQQVKNAVIVPVGAKGGFVAKQLPPAGGREEVMAEGIAAYRIFISSLLDITDNLDGQTLIAPDGVVRHDGDDPYLVVAADKGTATFSDTANEISAKHNFWLGDAFASGGSAGYDHKKMAITARGAWEAVKRHFRELNRNIQCKPFTVVGIGDMSGDVFGNGMLLSPATKLVAAFDHRDIFIDPDPDPLSSLAERRRLFEMKRSSWRDYDTEIISAGGGVFSRKQKSIPLSRKIKLLLDLSADRATPEEIMRAILKARADLLWFGGIGTFVRAEEEINDNVGDRANDAIRICAGDLRATVVGEGANLGMTQKARIAFGLAGGRCNTDAIDNSAGVNTSDVEVNIKIALDRAVRAGRLAKAKRNRMLSSMTEEVAALVLRNNYLQPLAISLSEQRGFEDFSFQLRLMQTLEARGLLDRAVETLPDDAIMAERQKSLNPLTRAEIAVLIAYSKLVLFDDLVAGEVVDDPALAVELFGYFPKPMQNRCAAEIESHRLRREIIATMLANSMINRGGPTYLTRIADRTGAGISDIARAYFAVRKSFGLQALHAEIDALDSRVPGAVQLELYRAVQDLLHSRTAWFVRNVNFEEGVGPVSLAYSEAFATIEPLLMDVLPADIGERIKDRAGQYQADGVPAKLARRIASLSQLSDVTDIHLIAAHAGSSLEIAAQVFFAVAGHFNLSRIVSLAHALPVNDYYDGLALDQALETLAEAHRRIAAKAIAAGGESPLDSWLAARGQAVEQTIARVAALTDGEALTVSRATVAANLLADLAKP